MFAETAGCPAGSRSGRSSSGCTILKCDKYHVVLSRVSVPTSMVVLKDVMWVAFKQFCLKYDADISSPPPFRKNMFTFYVVLQMTYWMIWEIKLNFKSKSFYGLQVELKIVRYFKWLHENVQGNDSPNFSWTPTPSNETGHPFGKFAKDKTSEKTRTLLIISRHREVSLSFIHLSV